MKIKTDEITSVIKQEIEQYSSQLEISEVGQVVEVGDGIARIYGLSNVMASELLEFETNKGTVQTAIVINAAGQWAPRLSAMVGALTPMVPMMHQYVTTRHIPVHELP